MLPNPHDASAPANAVPPVYHHLPTRLLLLIIFLLFSCGLLIHLLFLVNFQKAFLERYIEYAYMASQSREAGATASGPTLEVLLNRFGVLGYTINHGSSPHLYSPQPTWQAEVTLDLHQKPPYHLFQQTLRMIFSDGERVLQIRGSPDLEPTAQVALLLKEQPLHAALTTYSRQLLLLTVMLSLIVAVLFFLGLRWFIARDLGRITANLGTFRLDPEDEQRTLQPSGRRDEIGVLEQELARMQRELRAALAQRSRLAALGTAVSRINHDLKSILSTVSIASVRLARVDDPTVRKIAPLLVESVERAVQLCTSTQDLARGDQEVPRRIRLCLRPVVEEVGKALKLDAAEGVQWQNEVAPDLEIEADSDRLYRILLNLARNAMQALAGQGVIRVSAARHGAVVVIDIQDDGPGVTETVLPKLFQPFTGSGRPGGTGLGLATARDLARAHRGDLKLTATGPQGTRFTLTIPDADPGDTLIPDRRKQLRVG